MTYAPRVLKITAIQSTARVRHCGFHQLQPTDFVWSILRMSIRYFATAAAAVLSLAALSAPARAENVDVSTFTCAELTSSFNSKDIEDQRGAAALIYWMHGYLGTEKQGTLMNPKAFDKSIEGIVADCAKSPQVSMMTVARRHMGEKEGKPGKDALDFSILTCEYAVANSGEKDMDGLVQVLMWIVGYHASGGSNTVINLDAFGKAAEKIGEYCVKNPKVSLMTATGKFVGNEGEKIADTTKEEHAEESDDDKGDDNANEASDSDDDDSDDDSSE
jgi:acid stress chaperone HdeB